ncbi:MAG TPA: alpha/beta hydrolase [Candidatus Saccharimonadales bacterium]|nr:alpha/beta hydrolase [Candidatus Saccharimonadales bacterium]
MAKNPHDAAQYIAPLNMNGLQGRMLHIPAKKGHKREILFVYGHHSSLERWWGLMANLSNYGSVTMPDLPGFGGMDSFYKIGKEATLDNLADYLAAFVKLRYKRRRFIIVGMSLGFVIATRMLQRYPELSKKVDLLVSFAGFAHKDDFSFSKRRMQFYLLNARFFSLPVTSSFFRHVILHKYILRTVYRHTNNAKNKFKGVVGEELQEMLDVEVRLWHDNDVRTYMKTTVEFLTLDNCKKQVDLPVYHIAVQADQYFDNAIVEQHMRVIFKEFHQMANIDVAKHAPSVIADEAAAAPFIPPKLRQILNKLGA